MSFIPEEFAKTVRIPVKIVKGKITYLYGKEMPTLEEGAIGELILRDHAVNDEWRASLQEEQVVEILKPGSELLLAMRLHGMPTEMYEDLYDFDFETRRTRFVYKSPGAPEAIVQEAYVSRLMKCWSGFGFVPVTLYEPLELLLRGTKKAILKRAACSIPALRQDAYSLNHAFTLVSQVFEPGRMSHTGNMFERVRYNEDGAWRLLDDLRNHHEATHRVRLVARRSPAVKHDLVGAKHEVADDEPSLFLNATPEP